MCRWLAYSGNAAPISRLVYDTEHSLIDQSLSARSSVQTSNGDGFGVVWYDHHDHDVRQVLERTMDVRVARVPAAGAHVDPPLQLEGRLVDAR